MLLVEILDRLCSGLVGVGEGVWKREKNEEIVIMSVTTWYHSLKDCT